MNGPSQRFCLTEINLRQSLLPSPANWTLASNLAVIDPVARGREGKNALARRCAGARGRYIKHAAFQDLWGLMWGRNMSCAAKAMIYNDNTLESGGPRRIRTPDPLIRSQVLYPAELSVRGAVN